ncbi:MAG TPA: thioredoxin [Thermoplasmatales archaeon]|nr:thioredoxin [Candidatus Thermoplasmatota archaeon]HDS58960.1 thioredoxin [Thermoplasmatales archaeon]
MEDEVSTIRKKKMESLLQKMTGGSTTPNKPVAVTDDTLDQTVGSHPLVVVDCWAPWCGPCRMLGPVIDQLAGEMKGQVVFAKLNTDENRVSSSRYGIMSIPTLLLFKNGQLVDRNVGALPPDMLRDWIQRYL